MMIDIKYPIGTRVRFRRMFRDTYNEPCKFCGETGKVQGVNGEWDYCPKCDGMGEIQIENKEVGEDVDTISKIKVNWTKDNKPKVYYVMWRWALSYTDIPQEDIIAEIGNED